MQTALRQEFDRLRQLGEISHLEAVMLKCRSRKPKIGVTVVGAGDALINRYWPTLLEYITQQKIVLNLADKGTLEEVAEQKISALQRVDTPQAKKMADTLRDRYEQLQRSFDLSQRKPIQYFDLNSDGGKHRYETLTLTDFVFVLVPDDQHLNEARKWLSRSSMIFVEKPYATSERQAREFEEAYQALQAPDATSGGNSFVLSFDHYFAKIAPFLNALERGTVLAEIGRIQSIEFVLTEVQQPEPHRLQTLEGGLILDLHPHVLAVLSAFGDLNSIDGKEREVKVAKVDNGWPYTTETFASMVFTMEHHQQRYPFTVNVTVGKGVGKDHEKYMLVTGKQGRLLVNFAQHPIFGEPQASRIFGNNDLNPNVVADNRVARIYSSGHTEFIDALLSGHYLEEPCGGLMREQAHSIMRELDTLREGVARVVTKVGPMATYAPGESRADIQQKATLLQQGGI